MPENHFWYNIWPFQVNMQLFCFHKMAAGGHFGGPNSLSILFRHYRWISNFFLIIFLTKGPPAAILDIRKSLAIAFLAIFQINTQLSFIFKLFTKWPLAAMFFKSTINILGIQFRAFKNSMIQYFRYWSFIKVVSNIKRILDIIYYI